MFMTKIQVPNWVFDNLEAFDNCALPNECMDMDREELKNYLEEHTGKKIRLRESLFEHCDDTTITKNKRKRNYLIAEVIKK